jgi:hypothetical protein
MLKQFLAFLRYCGNKLHAFSNFEGWFLFWLGLGLYTARLPLPADTFVNLPMLVTIVQVAGLMFMLSGLQVFISILMWPNVRLKALLEMAEQGNQAAGLAAAGLMLFNGLSLLAQVLWLIYGSGARIGA